MMRFSVEEGRDGYSRIRLEGRLVGPWVDELGRLCDSVTETGRRLQLDFSSVSFLDRSAVALVRRLAARRDAEIERCPPFVAAQVGSTDALIEELVRTQSGKLLAVARRILRDDDQARDALQDAFLNAFRAKDRFQGEASPATWLHRIVVNACLMRLRSAKRRAAESIEDLLPTYLEDGHATQESARWREPAERQLARRELRALVRSCIDRLPERYRIVLLLRDIEELDTEETAAMLGITPNAAKIRLHRARQALRTLLDPHLRGGSV